jgi:hypothetical protein
MAVCFFIIATLSGGVPALRHDWFWPVERAAFLQTVAGWTSGWDLTGLGHPATHVAQYLLVIPMLLTGLVGGSTLALAVYVALIGAVIAHAAVRIGKPEAPDRPGALVLTGFLCLNPWVYSELVAGHLGMLLAYGSTIVVGAELARPEPRPRATALAMFGASFQPQFFALAWLGCILRSRTRGARMGATYGALAILPFAAGIASHPAVVASTPLTLTWERVQSVHPLDAFLVRGYFARYDGGFAGWAGTLATATFALLAAAGAIVARRTESLLLAVLTILCALFAAGTRGLLAPLVAAGFANAPALGLYRELFDLIGLVAAGYALLAARAFARFPVLRWPAGIAVLLLASVWVSGPPGTFWLGGASLPAAERGTMPGRYAFFPPFQPFTYKGRGSGVDSALAYPSLALTPLNTYAFGFPESTALAAYWHGGATTALARLGTQRLICRPGFAESADATGLLGRAIAFPAPDGCAGAGIAVPAAAPLFALQATTRVCSLCRNVGDGDLFFGDADPHVAAALGLAPGGGTYRLLAPPRTGTDPRAGWIDARLVFAEQPEIAQGFGGAFTTSDAALPVSAMPQALVAVRGDLRDERGTLVARDTGGYRWAALSPNAEALRCHGSCAVALLGDPPAEAPLEAGRAPAESLDWHRPAPWLVAIDVPAGSATLVRSLDSYDDSWFAFGGGRLAEHVRLDALLNGWLLSPRARPETLVAVHAVSVLQLLLEVLGTCAFLRALGLRRRAA